MGLLDSPVSAPLYPTHWGRSSDGRRCNRNAEVRGSIPLGSTKLNQAASADPFSSKIVGHTTVTHGCTVGASCLLPFMGSHSLDGPNTRARCALPGDQYDPARRICRGRIGREGAMVGFTKCPECSADELLREVSHAVLRLRVPGILIRQYSPPSLRRSKEEEGGASARP